MLLKKGEITKKLTNEETIKIFLSSGWEEVKAADTSKEEKEKKDSKPKPNTRNRNK